MLDYSYIHAWTSNRAFLMEKANEDNTDEPTVCCESIQSLSKKQNAIGGSH